MCTPYWASSDDVLHLCVGKGIQAQASSEEAQVGAMISNLKTGSADSNSDLIDSPAHPRIVQTAEREVVGTSRLSTLRNGVVEEVSDRWGR